jgi:outer membrane protein assembly factor BamA
MNYDTSKLQGFGSGVKNVYVEHEFAFDSRRQTSDFATRTLDASGWYASLHTGIARGIQGDPTRYFRYGGEVQRYFDLYDGTRVLALRALFDAVAGTDGRTDGRIAFTDLPRLGGSEYLRGYAADRFRDRAVALGTVEYQWAVGNNFAAYTFVDVGRPMESIEDAKRTDVFRMGFGGGLQIHTRNTFFTRLQVAASREGDLLFNLIFSPAFGRRERAGIF